VDVVRDAEGDVVELRCVHDPESRGGNAPDGRKVKGTIHWVAAETAVDAEARLYDRLFMSERPGAEGGDLVPEINPDSLKALKGCKLEPSLASADPETTYQFERLGYFKLDLVDSTPEKPVFNRAVPLRDTWAKMQAKK
jgi:glutaminyl-tRNA synthetase